MQNPSAKARLTFLLFAIGLIGSLLVNGVDTSKALLGSLTAALSVAGLGYCAIDAVWGNNRPHVYSWLIWTILDGVVWYNQWTHGAGPGAWSTLVMTVLSGLVTVIAIWQYLRGDSPQRITRMDQWCLVGALASIGVLVAYQSGPLSIIVAAITDIFAFAPTITKIWHNPHSETPVNYALNTVRHVVALFAMESYNFVTLLFPFTLLFSNALTVAMIIIGRRRIRIVPTPLPQPES